MDSVKRDPESPDDSFVERLADHDSDWFFEQFPPVEDQRIGSEFGASSWIVVGVALLLALVVLGGIVWFVVWGWRG